MYMYGCRGFTGLIMRRISPETRSSAYQRRSPISVHTQTHTQDPQSCPNSDAIRHVNAVATTGGLLHMYMYDNFTNDCYPVLNLNFLVELSYKDTPAYVTVHTFELSSAHTTHGTLHMHQSTCTQR